MAMASTRFDPQRILKHLMALGEAFKARSFNPLRSAEDIETDNTTTIFTGTTSSFNPLRSAEDIETLYVNGVKKAEAKLQPASIRRGY